jgi:hypothetical protein
MKQLIINAIVNVADSEITEDDVKKALQQFGNVQFTYSSAVEMVENISPIAADYWIYISPDDSEPYSMVLSQGETDGTEVTDDFLEYLRTEGVCVEFYALYPRADRYGSPLYATNDIYAKGEIDTHGFKVLNDGFIANSIDNGDDSSEQIWLKIAVPTQA